MVLRILKSNRSVNHFLLPLSGVLFWLKSLLSPQTYKYYRGETDNLLYIPIEHLLKDSVFLQNILALVLIIILALLIRQINNRYSIIRFNTNLPGLLFIIMMGGFTKMHTIHPVYFSSILLLIAIYRLFSAFDKSKPYSETFDTGFLLGIASLFYFNTFILLPAFLLGSAILPRETRWRNFVLMITGFLLPFLFAFSYTIITESSLELFKTFELNTLTYNNHIKKNVPIQFFLGYLLLLIFLGSMKIIKQYDYEKVSTRKFFTIFFLLFICSIIGLTIIPAVSQEMLMITTIPVTYLVANYFVHLKNRFWGESLFIALIVIVTTLLIII